MLKKKQRVHLHGPALRALNDAIHERDHHKCVICGRYVSPTEKFHHEPPGAGRSDEIEKGVTLCLACHAERHFSANCNAIRDEIRLYLAKIYGGQNGY